MNVLGGLQLQKPYPLNQRQSIKIRASNLQIRLQLSNQLGAQILYYILFYLEQILEAHIHFKHKHLIFILYNYNTSGARVYQTTTFKFFSSIQISIKVADLSWFGEYSIISYNFQTASSMEKNKNKQAAQSAQVKKQPAEPPVQACKFEELKGEFEIKREIGRGSYGVVFKGVKKDPNDLDENGKPKQYAIKRIFPTINAAFILIEMLILKHLNGESNVTDLISGYRLDGQVSLVFKFQKSKPFLTYLTTFLLEDIRKYMYAMMKAVKHLSDHGVIHRDIKPSNFLYDPTSHTGLLIDFGLSEIEVDAAGRAKKMAENETVKKIVDLQKKMKIKNRTGTKGYMPPEALFNHPNQGSAVDVWACGVIFLSFLAQRHPIFSLNNSSKIKNFTISNLIPFVCLFGSNNIKEIAFKLGYGVLIPDEMQKERIEWKEICKIQDDCAFDLLNRMLELDYTKRITPEQVLEHAFFKGLHNGGQQDKIEFKEVVQGGAAGQSKS